MNIQKSLDQAFSVLKLKEPVMHALASDKNALTPALFLVALSAVVGSLGLYFFPFSYREVTYQLDSGDLAVEIVRSVIWGIAGLYIVGFLAEKVFHSHLSMQGYVQVMGHAALVGILAIYPPLTLISGIWFFVVFCYVLSKLCKLSVGKIILLLLLIILITGLAENLYSGVFGSSIPGAI